MPKADPRAVVISLLLALAPVAAKAREGGPAPRPAGAQEAPGSPAGPEAHATTATPTAADSAAIRATALDYIEGWYTADAARMERALHPHLAKRFLEPLPNGGVRLTDTSALELVQQVRAGGGSNVPVADRRTDVAILDIFQDVASVRVDAHGWIDYMHLARAGGQWRIVNVLWEIRDPADGPAGR